MPLNKVVTATLIQMEPSSITNSVSTNCLYIRYSQAATKVKALINHAFTKG